MAAADGRDVDDRALAALLHVFEHVLAHPVGAVLVDLDDIVVPVLFALVDGLVLVGDARGVHEHIDPAVFGDAGVDGLPAFLLHGEVGRDARRDAALLDNLIHDLLVCIDATRNAEYLRALFCKQHCRCASDARVGARDEGDLAVKLSHVMSLLRGCALLRWFALLIRIGMRRRHRIVLSAHNGGCVRCRFADTPRTRRQQR